MSAAEIFSVQGKVAFVTGAGSGLGRALAESMAENGANVAGFDLYPDGLQETRRLCEAVGAKVVTIVGDVSDKVAVEAAVERTVAELGRLDIAFANAGIGDPEPGLLHEYDDANWKKVVDVNLNGVFYTDRAALRQMMRQGAGKIINIASMWGLAGASSVFPIPAYNATKGAVVNLTREMALQWARKGVRVNALCPGWFPSEMTAGMEQPDGGLKWIQNNGPMPRMGEAQELDGPLLLLCSDASTFMTGHSLVVDGGWLAR